MRNRGHGVSRGWPPADFETMSLTSPCRCCNIISTIGAGDTFIAGILYTSLCRTDSGQEWDDPDKLRFAADLATEKVQREGFKGLAACIARTLTSSEQGVYAA